MNQALLGGGGLTEVVKNLLIINVLMYLGTMVVMGDERVMLGLFYPIENQLGENPFAPYQIATHMFMHADFGHLLMNMLGIFFLGPQLESNLGSKRFLLLYVLSGLAGALGWFAAEFYELRHYDRASAQVVWGASGAVFGVLAAFGAMFPHQRLMLIFPPIPMKAWVLVAVLAVFELTSGISGRMTGIAHYAHLAGGLMGFLMVMYWQRR